MTSLFEEFCNYYKPLVEEFVAVLTKAGPAERYAKIPELFLPAWGNRYEKSLLKIAFIGRDTATWGQDIHKTVDRVRKGDWGGIFDQSEFRNLDYINWNRKGTRYTFWGFALYFPRLAVWRGELGTVETEKPQGHFEQFRMG